MKNKTWDIVTLFWTDGKENSDRTRNALFTIEKNIELVKYLNKNNANVNYLIYDFSPYKIIKDSIHIPYPLSVYKRSEKINFVLEQTQGDFFSIIDSDCFFDEIEYPLILDLYKNLKLNEVYNFDWKKLHEDSIDWENKIIKDKNKFDFAIGQNSAGGLGAFFIVPTLELKKIDGFDEKITTWGGEDGEVLDRLLKNLNRNCIFNFSPYHLPHFTDWENKLYYDNK